MRTSLRSATLFCLLVLTITAVANAQEKGGDNVPMYGQPAVTRTAKQKQADEAFIAEATAAANGDRKAAARSELDQAQSALTGATPNEDEAIRHFNKAWLLDADNFQVHWGFGHMQLVRGNIDDAVRHFDKALDLVNDSDMKASLSNDAGIAYSLKASRATAKDKRSQLFAKANELFQQSVKLDPAFGAAWLRWSQSLQREGNYAEAWAKLKTAQENGVQAPKSYLKTLSEKMPEPKGPSP